MDKPLTIGIVGPCTSGKSTLIAGLRQHGYEGRHIAQDHSYVPDMWQRLVHPDLLIYLHVSYSQTLARRKWNWSPEEYAEQVQRLEHARQHADLWIDTDPLTPEAVLERVLAFLK